MAAVKPDRDAPDSPRHGCARPPPRCPGGWLGDVAGPLPDARRPTATHGSWPLPGAQPRQGAGSGASRGGSRGARARPIGERIDERRRSERERLEAAAADESRIRNLATACLDSLPLRPSTLREWRRLVSAEVVPAFGDRQARDVTRREIRPMGSVSRDGVRSRRTGLSRSLESISWAVEYEYVAGTPFVGLKKPGGAERQSERVLSGDEGLRPSWSPSMANLPRSRLRRRCPSSPCYRYAPGDGPRGPALQRSSTSPAAMLGGRSRAGSKVGRRAADLTSSALAEALAVVARRLEATSGEALFP